MMRGAVTVTLTLAAVGLVAACSDEEIVLASVPETDVTTENPRQTPVRCIRNEECSGNEFCQYDTFGLVPSGECAHKPSFCTSDKIQPVCAISGITYLNDCYRKQAGESARIEGECPNALALRCSADDPCPTGATCELLGGGSVADKTCGAWKGHCWGIIQCPAESPEDPDRWDECSTETGALRCVDRCRAIQTGRPFTKSPYGCAKK